MQQVEIPEHMRVRPRAWIVRCLTDAEAEAAKASLAAKSAVYHAHQADPFSIVPAQDDLPF